VLLGGERRNEQASSSLAVWGGSVVAGILVCDLPYVPEEEVRRSWSPTNAVGELRAYLGPRDLPAIPMPPRAEMDEVVKG
jgi:hypothetical protein